MIAAMFSTARQWELAHFSEFDQWRSRSGGLAKWQLATLLDAVRTTTFSWGSVREGRALSDCFDDVLTRCNDLIFDDPAETSAYALLHLADRYGRACQVLEHLMSAGQLPLRRKHLKILDVGCGPAPNLYAALDFYTGINDWVRHSGQDLTFASNITVHSIDRGPGWKRLIHYLSEHLLLTRNHQTVPGIVPPFGITFDDLTGFAPRENTREAYRAAVRAVDRFCGYDDEYLTDAEVRAIAYHRVADSAYDLIFASNFLTQPHMIDTFEHEIVALSRSLSRGGLLIITGSASHQYQPIWDRLATQMRAPGLVRLHDFAEPIATARGRYARPVREHTLASLDLLRAQGLPVSDTLYVPRFPTFQVMAWKRVYTPRRAAVHRTPFSDAIRP
ncbi:hypothetical protein [Nocardia sp. NPDC051981]|uniref:hypothetical protein n=1 Tax=Nocardia sp. NPDC051981 TaxID=3155417 RepID=UPI00342485A6